MVSEKNIKVNAILNVIKTISGIVFHLITFPYISRILQPENVGKVNFSSSFVSYFTMLAGLGITTYAIRECSAVRNDKEKLERTASEIFSVNIITAMASYLVLFVFLFFFRKLDSYRMLIIIQSVVILFNTLGADWLNTAMEDFFYITVRTMVFQVISLVLMFIFVRTLDDYIKYSGILVLSSSGASLLNIFYRRKYCKIQFTLKMRWKIHFKPILLLFVMIFAQTIFNSADVTMIGLIKSDFEVGIYSTAVKIENIIAQVVSSLAWVVMPRMSAYFAEDNYEKINKILKKVLGILLLIGLPSISGVLSLAREIVWIIGGKEYIQSAVPLMILTVAFFFSLFGGSFLGNMVLLPSKNEKTYMSICCIAAFANVILNFIFIPFWGANAAAATTVFSSFLIFILLLIKKDRKIKLDYLKEVGISPLIGSLIIMVYCFLMKHCFSSIITRTGICIIGSVFLYAAVTILMKNELCMEVLIVFKNKMKRHQDKQV